MSDDATQEPADAALRRSGAVHDVNQMLTAVIGRAQLALAREGSDAASPRLAADLRAILLAARDAVGMLQRLRGAAAEPGGCDVGAALRAAADIILPPDGRWRDGDGPGWRLEVRAPSPLGAAVPAAVLREVTANLIRNALEAQSAGGAVRLTAEAAGGAVVVRVADDGPGLAPGADERIFEAGVTGSAQAGRGIGLAACRQLLADHGAVIRARSGDGGGAVFEIILPAAAVSDAAAPEPAAATAARHLRVLVVDDEPAVRGMLQDVLHSLGCDVTAAAGADDALASCDAGENELALIDHALPGVDGPELARRLRRRDGALVTVLMTGLGNEAALADADAASVDRTLTKPLDLAALRRLLRDAAALHARRAGAAPNTNTRDDEP